MMNKIKAISVFSSAGIGELLLKNTNVEVVAANELLPKRAECYSHFYPNTDMYCGDITLEETQDYMVSAAQKSGAKMLIATPPCQGLSTLGKNKKQIHYEKDRRNYLILSALNIIDRCDFDYVLIENVPTFLEMYFPYENDYFKLEEILNKKYSSKYKIEARVLNAKDYGICQSRPRAIIKMYKPDKKWSWPSEENEITLREAIGYLPSLESGESSDIPWHFAKSIMNEQSWRLSTLQLEKALLRTKCIILKKKMEQESKDFIILSKGWIGISLVPQEQRSAEV